MLYLDFYTWCDTNKVQHADKTCACHGIQDKPQEQASSTLLLLSGDIATNPGPATRISNLCRPFGVFYQNVRSLKSTYYLLNTKENKLSSFHNIVSTNQFDVIALTETWLDSSISNHELLPSGYKISIIPLFIG
jgi:hypothetical protein